MKLAYPRIALNHIAGNLHVYSTREQVREALMERIGKAEGWNEHSINRAVSYVKACHNRHLRMLRSVNL